MLEDAHLSLRAARHWQLLMCGDAQCTHNPSPKARLNSRRVGYKCVVNYYYVFNDIAGPLSWRKKARFWRFQLFELVRVLSSAIRRRRRSDFDEVIGRLEGWRSALGKRGNGRGPNRRFPIMAPAAAEHAVVIDSVAGLPLV
jgi:hypothetical protein